MAEKFGADVSVDVSIDNLLDASIGSQMVKRSPYDVVKSTC